MTTRLETIKTWLSHVLPVTTNSRLHYLQSDASSRRYLRYIVGGQSYIIMDDSKSDSGLLNFVALSDLLLTHKINVPQILAMDLEAGLLLLSDLGDNTYLRVLRESTQERIDSLYLDALTGLLKLQRIDVQCCKFDFKVMDAVYIADRLSVFKQWYLQEHLGLTLTDDVLQTIAYVQEIFVVAYAAQPHTFVHVDYHSRNLMVTSANNPGMLDYQDAMLGPVTYDLVSLLQDAYIEWPREMVESVVNTYSDLAIRAGIMPSSISNVELLKYFDLVGLHRHLKNLGVFARLHYRDGKSGYLQDIPMLLRYIIRTCERYAELGVLLEFMQRHLTAVM